tara:strand:+ start:654 stop:860 length:207 start_codon:yes stop_codon:yes gene_type:complete
VRLAYHHRAARISVQAAHQLLDTVDRMLQPRTQRLPPCARRLAPPLIFHLAGEDRVDRLSQQPRAVAM